MQLSGEQVALVVGAVTVIGWAIQFLWSGLLGKPKPTADVLKVIAFLLSVAFTWVWSPIQLPAMGDNPVIFALALLTQATAFFKFANVVYDLVWKKLMEVLNAVFRTERFMPRRA